MTAQPQRLEQFSINLIRVARLYRKEVDRSLASYGVSEAKAVPVLYIHRYGGGMRQSLLAEELGIEGPSLVRLLDQLCSSGLVERRDDSHDRRAKQLHLTLAGEELAVRVEAAILEIRGRLLASLEDADIDACVRVFEALTHKLATSGDVDGKR